MQNSLMNIIISDEDYDCDDAIFSTGLTERIKKRIPHMVDLALQQYGEEARSYFYSNGNYDFEKIIQYHANRIDLRKLTADNQNVQTQRTAETVQGAQSSQSSETSRDDNIAPISKNTRPSKTKNSVFVIPSDSDSDKNDETDHKSSQFLENKNEAVDESEEENELETISLNEKFGNALVNASQEDEWNNLKVEEVDAEKAAAEKAEYDAFLQFAKERGPALSVLRKIYDKEDEETSDSMNKPNIKQLKPLTADNFSESDSESDKDQEIEEDNLRISKSQIKNSVQ